MTQRQGFTPDDFWRLRFITDLRLAGNGAWLAYTLQQSDEASNSTRSAIWLLNTATWQSRQLTHGRGDDTCPRFSPDGARLAFLSNREGVAGQIWLLALDGGEATRIAPGIRGASELSWSPDGASLYFKRTVKPEGESGDLERPRATTRLQYRWDGKGYLDGRTHVFRVDVKADTVEQLTSGDVDCAHPAPSPDGRWLAYLSDQADDRDANMSTDLYVMDLDSRASRRLTDGNHRISHVSWSPASDRIAFLAEPKVSAHSAYNVGLHVITVTSGEVVDLMAGADRSAEVGLYGDIPGPGLSTPIWTPDGRAIICLTQQGGGVDVISVNVASRAIQALAHGPHIACCALSPDGARLYTAQCAPRSPWNIFAYPLSPSSDASARLELTHLNDALLAERDVVEPERFAYPSFDGALIDAWLYRPMSATAAPAPLVLWLHGGPDSAYGESFYLLAHILTAKGYAVLHLNPRGSAGYGEAFTQAVDFDWGGGDYQDVMAGVDAAIARGGLDGERMAVMGASYGGYLTNWIIGQTQRFRAAVTINSVTNLLSCFGTADLDPVWAQGYYGWPWENMDFYLERSPITHAHKVTTPTRIIAAERDYRCPMSQSEEWFTWLKKRSAAPVDFVWLPGATHTTFASPRQRIERMRLVVEWIDRWLSAPVR